MGISQQELHDPLGQVLQGSASSPEDVIALRDAITNEGGSIASTMVANRRFHNPDAGSFSVFESVSGTIGGKNVRDHQFFFGHFTRADGGNLVLDQQGGLMVEAIAWGPSKGLYNFYELLGLPNLTPSGHLIPFSPRGAAAVSARHCSCALRASSASSSNTVSRIAGGRQPPTVARRVFCSRPPPIVQMSVPRRWRSRGTSDQD